MIFLVIRYPFRFCRGIELPDKVSYHSCFMSIYVYSNSMRKVCHLCVCRSTILDRNEDNWRKDNQQVSSPTGHLN
jgi:hypothetical protein